MVSGTGETLSKIAKDLEKYIIDGMEHAWSGGNSRGFFTDPQGPKASEIILDFFSNYSMSGADTTLP